MSKQDIVWKSNFFEELTVDELYSILHLRCEIFVLEQNAPYLDPDYKDQKALHLQGYIDDKLVAYCRLFKAGDYFEESSIGRVLVSNRFRGHHYGHQLMNRALGLMEAVLNETKITISAQLYLQKFYESHGFARISDIYLEDGLPHVQMRKE